MAPSLPIHEHEVMNIIIFLNSAKVLVKGRFCEKIVCVDSPIFLFHFVLFSVERNVF